MLKTPTTPLYLFTFHTCVAILLATVGAHKPAVYVSTKSPAMMKLKRSVLSTPVNCKPKFLNQSKS